MSKKWTLNEEMKKRIDPKDLKRATRNSIETFDAAYVVSARVNRSYPGCSAGMASKTMLRNAVYVVQSSVNGREDDAAPVNKSFKENLKGKIDDGQNGRRARCSIHDGAH